MFDFNWFLLYITGVVVVAVGVGTGPANLSPVFCLTKHFDSIFNYGPKLMIKSKLTNSDRWLWTYSIPNQSFSEPPVRESTDGDDWSLMTSFYVSDIAYCGVGADSDCRQQRKAYKMYFTREYSDRSGIERTIVRKVMDNNNGADDIVVSPQDYPWGLTSDTDIDKIWPQNWNNDRNKARNSVFRPAAGGKFEVMFIVYNANEHMSALIWSDIHVPNWYESTMMLTSKLNTNVRFAGMFWYGGQVYAVGDRPLDNDLTSYVFRLNVAADTRYGDRRELINTTKTVTEFFRCKPDTTTTATTIHITSSSAPGGGGPGPGQVAANVDHTPAAAAAHGSITLIIIIIVVAVVSGLLILLFTIISCVYIRQKGTVIRLRDINTTTTTTADMNSQKSGQQTIRSVNNSLGPSRAVGLDDSSDNMTTVSDKQSSATSSSKLLTSSQSTKK
ncbi:uncharacterized protein LOC128957249 [Oppia nitens]|uniref:uncharacterized protein LOC128957249 n=1 Tax=Oppia nitens TaxID=1686743 RepID=UPI0023D97E5E|nr:uncharacterized protein LOC128957249 [Oppia nitens]